MYPPLEELFESSLQLTSSDDILQKLPSERGLLLFADANKTPIQLLSAPNLRRTALAKLAETPAEEPIRKADLRPIASLLYYTQIGCQFHCLWLYNQLTDLLFPKKMDLLISLPAAHCVRVDPTEAWTAFTSSAEPYKDPEAVYFGPFPTRKAADFYAQFFNNVFTLCRNHRLAISKQGQKCSYYQMGLCPGPCLHKAAESQYRQTVLQAIEAASGPIQNLHNELTNRMTSLAANMQFEQAQIVKDQLAQLSKLTKSSYQWTSQLDTLKILHIDQNLSTFTAKNLRGKSPRFCSYLITSKQVEKMPNISLSRIQNTPALLSGSSKTYCLPSKNEVEHLAWISLFLYKSHPPGIWIDLRKKDYSDPETLTSDVAEQLSGMMPSKSK